LFLTQTRDMKRKTFQSKFVSMRNMKTQTANLTEVMLGG